jgi:integrase
MSTPENTSPTPEALETRYTISLLWQNGSGRCEYQRPLPAHVADMLAQGQCPLHVAIWKHSEPPLASVPSIVLPPKAEPRDRWLTRPEARQLRHAAMRWPHLYRFIVIGLLTGSRSGAILALKWDWIDWKAGTMLRRDPRESQDARKRTPPVRMGSRLIRLMRRWHAKDGGTGHVIHYNGQPVTRLQRTWRQAVKAAKLKDVTPHTLRHTRATWLMQAGIPIWEAAGALGMTPDILQSTYGKHHPDFQRRAAEV